MQRHCERSAMNVVDEKIAPQQRATCSEPELTQQRDDQLRDAARLRRECGLALKHLQCQRRVLLDLRAVSTQQPFETRAGIAGLGRQDISIDAIGQDYDQTLAIAEVMVHGHRVDPEFGPERAQRERSTSACVEQSERCV
jgi:hypothetical protein